MLLSNCDSKLSSFTTKLRNTNIELRHNLPRIKYDEIYNSESLQTSQNGNTKILKSSLTKDLDDAYNKKFNLENFFSEVYYEKENENQFTIYVKDPIVNSINYTQIFVTNSKNFFILQIPFDNGKTGLYRVDYGRDFIMHNYVIKISEDILKIIITLENNDENKRILEVRRLSKINLIKKFFKYFKARIRNKIYLNSAVTYHNKKLKRKILNLLNYFYFIKIKENVNYLKIRKFVLKRNNFIKKIRIYKNTLVTRNIHYQYMLVKLFLKIFKYKAIKLKQKIFTKNYRICMDSFRMKKFLEKKAKENVFMILKKEVNKRILYKNNYKMASFLHDFLIKKKYFNKIQSNQIKIDKNYSDAILVYKNKIKQKFFKKLLINRHHMKRFYYLSNNYNYCNFFFLFLIIQNYIKQDFIKFNKNNSRNINHISLTQFNTGNNIKDKNNQTLSINDNKENSPIYNFNDNHSNLIDDNSKEEGIHVVNNKSVIFIHKGFYKNCEFKILTNFKNYTFSNYYNNNFHYPLIKNIFDILKQNMRKGKNVRFRYEKMISKKLLLTKEINYLQIKMTKIRLSEHNKIQRKIFWNKFKIRINQKKLIVILKEKTEEKTLRLILKNNLIRLINEINRKVKIRNYFEYKKKYISNKILKFKFFEFLSFLYMKRKIERNIQRINVNEKIYNQNVLTYSINAKDERQQMQILQSNSKNFEQNFISRLISPTNYFKDLKQRFLNFQRMLNLRLNYYKLFINCKTEKILKTKTKKFKDICLKIYYKFFERIKYSMLINRQENFKKNKYIRSVFEKIIESIRYKKRNYFIKTNLINTSKKLSFTTLKEYYIYKKNKYIKQNHFKKKLNSLYYKYYYENYFLKNAEMIKIKNYFISKLKKIKIKYAIKQLKRNSNVKKLNFLAKKYMINKYLQNSISLINLRNKEENLKILYANKIKKYFFRYFLRNIKKLKIVNKIRNKKYEAIKLFKKNSSRKLINNVCSNILKKKIIIENTELLMKKTFLLKLKEIHEKIKQRKNANKKFFNKLILKKLKIKVIRKKNDYIKYEIIKKKFDKKLLIKFLIAKNIIAKTFKFNRILKEFFDRYKKFYLDLFFQMLGENDKEIFIRNRLKKIRSREFFKNLRYLFETNSLEKKKLKKLKSKYCLKSFLNSILQNMLFKQNIIIIKDTIRRYLFCKHLNYLKANVNMHKKCKSMVIKQKEFTIRQKSAIFKKLIYLSKLQKKIYKIKLASSLFYKRLLNEIFTKLQKNQFIRSQKRMLEELLENKIKKNLKIFKFNVKMIKKIRLINLKIETYKYKFGGTNNKKLFFKLIKRKISSNINFNESLKNKITKVIKIDTILNISNYNINFQK